jgi:uncharacterized SAM-binding protein YcdF (DUF218 family)
LTKDLGQRKRIRLWTVALVLTAMLLVFAANAGRLLVVDAPEPSDVILVLAGETDHRPARAVQLLEQGYARRVVIDVPAEAMIFGSSEVQLAEKYAQGSPQAAAIRICPIEGLSTRDETHDAAKCLVSEGGHRILIVTSEFHTRRALSIFRHELRGYSFSVSKARDEAEFGTRWWTHREWAKTCLGEWEKLVWWTVLERWK